MREQIYTIPLNEAFEKDSECPFCELQKKLEAEVLDYVLGPSYMEEDIRTETNKLGFCRYHYEKIFNAKNRLGAALMVSTHMLKVNDDLEKLLDEEKAEKPRGFLKKKNAESPFLKYSEELQGGCYACKRESGRMDSYFYTFFYLWKTEEEFRQKVASCKGFCIEHLARIIDESRSRLGAADRQAMLDTVIPLQKENMKRVKEELDWFVKKFDYRFHDEPWGNSKDALERAILKLSGTLLRSDPREAE